MVSLNNPDQTCYLKMGSRTIPIGWAFKEKLFPKRKEKDYCNITL